MVEAMQPSSSRAGMTTESSESGRAVLVSGRLGIFAFPNREAGGAGQVGDGKKRKTAEHSITAEATPNEGWEYFQNDGGCVRGAVYQRRLQLRLSTGHFGQ